jgi:hypothetical protein
MRRVAFKKPLLVRNEEAPTGRYPNDGPWTVRVQFANGSAEATRLTRDEAIQWAQREIQKHTPTDWFHGTTISVTFGD